MKTKIKLWPELKRNIQQWFEEYEVYEITVFQCPVCLRTHICAREAADQSYPKPNDLYCNGVMWRCSESFINAERDFKYYRKPNMHKIEKMIRKNKYRKK